MSLISSCLTHYICIMLPQQVRLSTFRLLNHIFLPRAFQRTGTLDFLHLTWCILFVKMRFFISFSALSCHWPLEPRWEPAYFGNAVEWWWQGWGRGAQPCAAACTAAPHFAAAAAHAAPLAAACHASAGENSGERFNASSDLSQSEGGQWLWEGAAGGKLRYTCIRRPMREAMAGGRGGRGGRADVNAPQSSPRGRWSCGGKKERRKNMRTKWINRIYCLCIVKRNKTWDLQNNSLPFPFHMSHTRRKERADTSKPG